MSYEARKFVQESYNQNNLLAKQILVAYLVSKNHIIKPDSFKENYGVDIVTEWKGEEYLFEVEMKQGYNFVDKKTFPFKTVSFCGRKEKWKNLNYEYCIINKNNYAAIFCNSSSIFKDEYKENLYINTEHRQGQDMFYRVPVDLCSFRTPEEFFKDNYLEIWDGLMDKTLYKVIIAGGRDFSDYDTLKDFCDKTLSEYKNIEIVSGTARGADSLGEKYAQEKGYFLKQFKPDWNIGKMAGILRNEQMGNYSNALIAFWDGNSKGTKHMIDYAKKKGLKIYVCKY
jgi:hypothetical protein